ncbi:hypothetical protein ANO14919_081830 [Xylariales sp. No.14919]|nr:hypothetical protein ANO14919_081830 [Xylariales sp. No.14919]
MGSYSDGCEVISNGLHIDPTSNYYAEVWVHLMNETLPSMLKKEKNQRATIQKVRDDTRQHFEPPISNELICGMQR